MFSDKIFKAVGFDSQISSNTPDKIAEIQTDEIVNENRSSQTAERRTIETQTIEELPKKPVFDNSKLAEFLKRVTPEIIKALDDIHGSEAFDEYDPGISDEISKTIKFSMHLNTLDSTDVKSKVSALSWSNFGGTLAVAHSVTYHETWCEHMTKIKFFNLTRDDQLISIPKKLLEVNSCVTSMAYHPSEPSILVAGLFNGDVLVWNLRDDNTTNPLLVCTHDDSISQVQWQSKFVNDSFALVSASSDGYIIINKLSANFSIVNLHKRCKIKKDHNPAEKTRPKSAGSVQERAAEAGLCVTCFDFSFKDPTLFIVGTLCGGLYKCNVEQSMQIEGDSGLFDPVVSEYSRHEGSVICIKCSQTRDLFVTTGTDKEIHVYNFEQTACLRTIELESTMIGLSWWSQDIFAAFGAGSFVNFYNATEDDTSTHVQLKAKHRINASSLSFNAKRNLAAIGDSSGTLEIWKIPRQSIS